VAVQGTMDTLVVLASAGANTFSGMCPTTHLLLRTTRPLGGALAVAVHACVPQCKCTWELGGGQLFLLVLSQLGLNFISVVVGFL
jgi:hypothetical protein